MASKREPWVVAIPSYDRLSIIESHTLSLVRSAGIPPRRVFVFADPRQTEEYRKVLQPFDVNVVPGEEGVCGQRNKIMSHFPAGARIVEMDDDIKGLMTSSGSVRSDQSATTVPVPDKSLPAIIDHLFEVADREGCALWGIYPVGNPWMLSRTYAIGLTKATAQLVGYYNPGEALRLRVPLMEDYERVLWLYSQGKRCLRCDYLGPRTANRGPGGCSSAFTEYKVEKDESRRRPDYRHPREYLEFQAATQLKELFPDTVASATRPKPVERIVQGIGEVLYYPPGWCVNFRQQIRYKSARDVAGDFAEMLGLGPGILPQKTVRKGSVVDLRWRKSKNRKRRKLAAEKNAKEDQARVKKERHKVRIKDPRGRRHKRLKREKKERKRMKLYWKERDRSRRRRRRSSSEDVADPAPKADVMALARLDKYTLSKMQKESLMRACSEEGLNDVGTRMQLAERLVAHSQRLLAQATAVKEEAKEKKVAAREVAQKEDKEKRVQQELDDLEAAFAQEEEAERLRHAQEEVERLRQALEAEEAERLRQEQEADRKRKILEAEAEQRRLMQAEADHARLQKHFCQQAEQFLNGLAGQTGELVASKQLRRLADEKTEMLPLVTPQQLPAPSALPPQLPPAPTLPQQLPPAPTLPLQLLPAPTFPKQLPPAPTLFHNTRPAEMNPEILPPLPQQLPPPALPLMLKLQPYVPPAEVWQPPGSAADLRRLLPRWPPTRSDGSACPRGLHPQAPFSEPFSAPLPVHHPASAPPRVDYPSDSTIRSRNIQDWASQMSNAELGSSLLADSQRLASLDRRRSPTESYPSLLHYDVGTVSANAAFPAFFSQGSATPRAPR